MKPYWLTSVAAALLLSPIARAGDISTSSSTPITPDTRYGPFGLLDHRSAYGQGAFPEPFLVDDSDGEDNEARLDWFRSGLNSSHSDLYTAEVEKGFGVATFEIEVPFERDSAPGDTESGFSNIDLGARTALFQYVSPNGWFDSTFGAGAEFGIPTNSPVSKNAEFVPKVFEDIKVGNFTVQAIVGYSMLFGPGDVGGTSTFEYGLDLGYTIDHKVLPIPGVLQVVPVFELDGEKGLNKGQAAVNSLLANTAVRFNLKPIGGVQPKLGFGYVFPLTQAAHDDVRWGLYTSLVFEY